jgi:HEAT repeat protein
LYEIFAREIEQRRLGQAEHPVKIDEDLSKAIRWLYELMDGPDQINGMMAGRILVDFGALAPDVFWQRFGSMALKGRDTLARVLLQREDESALMVLYAGLLQASEQQASKCRQLLQRSLGNGIEPAHLSVLESLSEQTQARVARRMALYGLLREFLARFDRIAARQRGVVFDLLEHLDCRPYEPFLLSCLEREDDLLVYRALRLLIQLEDGGYMEEFKNLLHRSDPEILLAVLEYMRVHGDVGVIPSLSPLLAHWDERVARQTVTTVFQLSRQHLLARYEDLNESSRQEIINLLHRLDEDFVEELCEDLSRLSSQEKVHLVNILEIVGQESKIQSALLKLSREPDQRVRATVAKAIQIFSEAQKKLELTRAFLEDEDTRVRANAVESLQNVDNEEIRQRLIRMTRSPHRRERANAIKKLWDLGYRDFEMSLVQMLDEPDEWTRASAVWVLGEIEAPHLSDLVEEKLDDESAVVRENAIQALNKRGTTEQVRQLTRFLEDPDRRVREAAQMAMRQRLNLSYEIT